MRRGGTGPDFVDPHGVLRGEPAAAGRAAESQAGAKLSGLGDLGQDVQNLQGAGLAVRPLRPAFFIVVAQPLDHVATGRTQRELFTAVTQPALVDQPTPADHGADRRSCQAEPVGSGRPSEGRAPEPWLEASERPRESFKTPGVSRQS